MLVGVGAAVELSVAQRLFRVRAGHAPDADALDAHCRARIGGYKRPRRYVFVEELPKTAAGKIQKAELRSRLRAGEWNNQKENGR